MTYSANLFFGWLGFLGGAASGALIGLYFHRDDWLGGYDSFPRRMIRLGHIAFFGIGLMNILFALSTGDTATRWSDWASPLFVVSLLTMSTTCFLTAWKKPFRHLFFIPAGSALLGIVALLVHLRVAG